VVLISITVLSIPRDTCNKSRWPTNSQGQRVGEQVGSQSTLFELGVSEAGELTVGMQQRGAASKIQYRSAAMRASVLCRIILFGVCVSQLPCGTAKAQISGLGDGNRVPLSLKQKNQSAKWLDHRRAELKKSGDKTKSRTEQHITWLKVIRRRHERLALRAAQAAAFQEGLAESYMQLAKRQMWMRTRSRVFRFEGNVVDGFNPIIEKNEREFTRSEPVPWSSNYGRLAAKHQGVANARRFQAETYYPDRIRNTDRRIQELEALLATEN